MFKGYAFGRINGRWFAAAGDGKRWFNTLDEVFDYLSSAKEALK